MMLLHLEDAVILFSSVYERWLSANEGEAVASMSYKLLLLGAVL